jgi:hypothetical protein
VELEEYKLHVIINTPRIPPPKIFQKQNGLKRSNRWELWITCFIGTKNGVSKSKLPFFPTVSRHAQNKFTSYFINGVEE